MVTPFKTLIALSIRQPWAWLIVHGGKNIENRTWTTKQRGWFAIHASQGMSRREYDEARYWIAMHRMEIELPAIGNLQRGGLIGRARIVGCVETSPSPWFTGPWGFVLADVEPLPFQACKGALGFFGLEHAV